MIGKSLRDSSLYETRFGFKERGTTFAFLLALLIFCVTVFGSMLFLITGYLGVVVDGSSMKKTLINGDKLFARRVKGEEANYGDIIIVDVSKYPECAGTAGGRIVKRLIAKEGDKVKCIDGNVSVWYAGGTGWEYLKEDYAYYGNYKQKYDFEEYEVGVGEIFFLGDNRSSPKSSTDSRYKEGKSKLTHLYKEEDIIGVVCEWSINHKWIGELLLKPEKK